MHENSTTDGNAASEDPLAELIRLVKQEDPFAETRQESASHAPAVADQTLAPEPQSKAPEKVLAPAVKPINISPTPEIPRKPEVVAKPAPKLENPAAKFIIDEPAAKAPVAKALPPEKLDEPDPTPDAAPSENFVPPVLAVRPRGQAMAQRPAQQRDLDELPPEPIVSDPISSGDSELFVEQAADLPPIDLDAALKAVRESDLISDLDFQEFSTEAPQPTENFSATESFPDEPTDSDLTGSMDKEYVVRGELASTEHNDTYAEPEIGNPYEDPAFASPDNSGEYVASFAYEEENQIFESRSSESREVYRPSTPPSQELHLDRDVFSSETAQPKRRRGLVFSVGLLLGLAVVGGSLAFAFLGTDQESNPSAPPVLRANSDPTKVAPENPGGQAIDYQNNPVYEGNSANNSSANEQLVPREEAIVGVPKIAPKDSTRPGSAPGALPAPLQPGSPATSRVVSVPPAATANNGDANRPTNLLPPASNVAPTARRVRTVVVRPDGTIVTNEPVESAASPEPATSAVATNGAEVSTVPVPSVRPVQPSDSQAPQQNASVNAQPQPRAQPQQQPSNPGNASAPINLTPPARTAQPQNVPAPQQQAGVPAPVPTTAPATGSGQFVVQVAARRNEEQADAAFADLRANYRSQIGSYGPLVERADLGDRGVYYRLRIGPMSSHEEASRVCNDLKTAGLSDCLVRPK